MSPKTATCWSGLDPPRSVREGACIVRPNQHSWEVLVWSPVDPHLVLTFSNEDEACEYLVNTLIAVPTAAGRGRLVESVSADARRRSRAGSTNGANGHRDRRDRHGNDNGHGNENGNGKGRVTPTMRRRGQSSRRASSSRRRREGSTGHPRCARLPGAAAGGRVPLTGAAATFPAGLGASGRQ